MSSTVPRAVPAGTSTTAGRAAQPPTVSSSVPGSDGVPAEAYPSGPSRPRTASCANVSALDSSVGRPPTPLSLALRLRPGGRATWPLTALTSAPPSPDTNLSGTWTTLVSRRRFGSARSAVATRPASALPATPTTISLAPSAWQASRAPAMTRYGDRDSSIASLALPGSPSLPFTRTTGLPPRAAADATTALSL